MMNSQTLTLKDTEIALMAALESGRNILLEGPPGVGKTALVERVAAMLGLPCHVLNLGEVQEVDVGGYPIVQGDRVLRLPLGPIHAATQGPCILFLDDYRLATPPVQGVSFRLFTHKEAGDIKLHAGCVIVLAANPVDQTPGGSPLSPPARSRVSIVRMLPNAGEIAPYFAGIGNPAGTPIEQHLRDLGTDFAATLDVDPSMLEMEPTGPALIGEEAWACPRAWETGLGLCAALLARGVADDSEVFRALLAGAIGPLQATAFLTLRKTRKDLPSVSEILANPQTAKLPTNAGTFVAALGVIAMVATRNVCAAWVYAERIPLPEFKMVLSTRLMGYSGGMNAKMPHYADASKARVKLQGEVTKLISKPV